MPLDHATLPLFADLTPATAAARSRAIAAVHVATALYTAEPIVDALLARLEWPNGSRKLLDPSCGDGMFLCRALTRLLTHSPSATPADILATLAGWEFHEDAANDARQRLTAKLVAHGWPQALAAATAARIVTTADFLTDYPAHATSAKVHVIAGNPPYMRMTHVPDPLCTDYTSTTAPHARGDLMHAFLDKCANILNDDGELAFVTADRWLFGTTTAKLRATLGRRFTLHHLERLDATTAFYRPKQRRANTPPRIHPVAVILRTTSTPTATPVTTSTRTPSPQPIPLTASPIYPTIADRPTHTASATRTLADIATITLAPWLGPHGIFTVDAATAATLPADSLIPAVDTRDLARRNSLDASTTDASATPLRFAIRTTTAEPPPTILDHLRRTLHRMPARGRRNLDWLPPESFHAFPLDRPALVLPRAARTLRPHRLPPGILPLNHALHITPTPNAPVTLVDIEAILTSPAAHTWITTHAAGIDNGFHWITATLLRRLPLP